MKCEITLLKNDEKCKMLALKYRIDEYISSLLRYIHQTNIRALCTLCYLNRISEILEILEVVQRLQNADSF